MRPRGYQTVGRRVRAVIGVGLAAVLLTPPAPLAAAPQGCASASGVYTGATPWPQRRLQLDRVWPLTNGSGVTVAVVSSGLDAAHPQFAPGQVGDGADTTSGRARELNGADCDGRGTAAAGIIGAQPDRRTPFVGVAPGVRLLPVRAVQAREGDDSIGSPLTLAAAISWAVERDARVIVVPVAVGGGDDALTEAVSAAVSNDVLVVAAGVPGEGAGRTYPTALPGVLAVTAVDADGKPVEGAERGEHIAVAGPGADLVTTAPGGDGRLGHLYPLDGPGFAAAYVAGVAALVRSYHPEMTAAEVRARLIETADRPRGDAPDPAVGYGMVNPYRAVADPLPGTQPVAGATRGFVPPDQTASGDALTAAARGWTAGLLLVVLALLVAIPLVRRGRARGWEPGR